MAIARPRMTEAEFMRLPHDGRKYELVDGEVKEVPTSFEHDAIVMHLAVLLQPFAKGRGFLTGSQAGFRMQDGNIRCPDVGFTLKTRLPDGKPPRTFATVAPDLAIEIISPTEEAADIQRKRSEYFASSAKQVWYLYPETQRVTLYRSSTEFTHLTAEDELDGGELLPGFRCRVIDLFASESAPSKQPLALYGAWRGKCPQDFDLDAVLKEVRSEWEKE